MEVSGRTNRSGGSAGSRGYDYQAEVYALIASKILAEDGLYWVETGCDRVPTAIQLETGTGGDDLRVTLRSGKSIDIQAKSSLRRGKNLWEPINDIAVAISSSKDVYGIIVTNTRASMPVREHLRDAIVKIGQGVESDLPDIAKELIVRLEDANFDPQTVCSRMCIIIRDLDPGSSGEHETLSNLRTVLADLSLVGVARNTLVSDGHDLMTLRGRRDAAGISRLLLQNNISLSPAVTNLDIVKQAYIAWMMSSNETILIPGMRITLPISNAWKKLLILDSSEGYARSKSLTEQLENYHEWHRLLDFPKRGEVVDADKAIRANPLMVVVSGPGSGKSTLLKSLAYSWSEAGELVLNVSLRAVAIQMGNGTSFSNALLLSAKGSFMSDDIDDLLRNASIIFADGLDETGARRAVIADALRRWALADNRRRLVITSRPIDYDPGWFPEWRHCELLPLENRDVEKLAKSMFKLLPRKEEEETDDGFQDFVHQLRLSRTASVAARNPQLLGFLIATHVKGYEIGGKRFRLLENIIYQIERQTVRDRTFRIEGIDSPLAHSVLIDVGWQLHMNPVVSQTALIHNLGQTLSGKLEISQLQGERSAASVLQFWEERGLLERLSIGLGVVIVFVHMSFQEHSVARYLAQLPDHLLKDWIRSNYTSSRSREILLLLGGTDKLEIVVDTLLELDVVSDPISIEAFVAAEVLAESEIPSVYIQRRVFNHLVPRLQANVPLVVYEAGEKLRPLATISPEMIGPFALELVSNEQLWTRAAACCLGLICGKQYVDNNVLFGLYPTISDTGLSMGSSTIFISDYNTLMNDLLIKGAEYLLEIGQIEIVKAKYVERDYSTRAYESLHKMLAKYIDRDELRQLDVDLSSNKNKTDLDESFRLARQSDEAILDAIFKASKSLLKERSLSEDSVEPDPQVLSIGELYRILKLGKSPIRDYMVLRFRKDQEGLIEVIRGAIVVTALNPAQVKADAQLATKCLQLSKDDFHGIYYDSHKLAELKIPVWELGRGDELDFWILVRALNHPASFVCEFAAKLLVNCFDGDMVYPEFENLLINGNGNALKTSCEVISRNWPEIATDLILNRLEVDVTEDCEPLIGELRHSFRMLQKERVLAVLEGTLRLNNANLVIRAINTVEALNLSNELLTTIEEAYIWWLNEGPQEPVGGGVVPKNAGAELLKNLAKHNAIIPEELFSATEANHSSIRKVAIEAICDLMEDDEELTAQVFQKLRSIELPITILGELSREHVDFCRRHMLEFIDLLTVSNKLTQIASIRALGQGWAEYSEVEVEMRPLLNSPDVEIRNEITRALHNLLIAS